MVLKCTSVQTKKMHPLIYCEFTLSQVIGQTNVFSMAEPAEEDILSTSFDASLEEFDQETVEKEEINETRLETGVDVVNEEESEEEIFESNLISEVSQVKDEMDKPLEKSDSCASLKRISFIEDNETKVYSEITDSTFVLPQGKLQLVLDITVIILSRVRRESS